MHRSLEILARDMLARQGVYGSRATDWTVQSYVETEWPSWKRRPRRLIGMPLSAPVTLVSMERIPSRSTEETSPGSDRPFEFRSNQAPMPSNSTPARTPSRLSSSSFSASYPLPNSSCQEADPNNWRPDTISPRSSGSQTSRPVVGFTQGQDSIRPSPSRSNETVLSGCSKSKTDVWGCSVNTMGVITR